MFSRRIFIALASAFGFTTKAEEAKRFVCVEVRQSDGTWCVEPRGLRGVSKGQWFRMRMRETQDSPVKLTAQADEDGHDVIDVNGHICGGLYYVEKTAVTE
jgi:hypothetical protein